MTANTRHCEDCCNGRPCKEPACSNIYMHEIGASFDHQGPSPTTTSSLVTVPQHGKQLRIKAWPASSTVPSAKIFSDHDSFFLCDPLFVLPSSRIAKRIHQYVQKPQLRHLPSSIARYASVPFLQMRLFRRSAPAKCLQARILSEAPIQHRLTSTASENLSLNRIPHYRFRLLRAIPSNA